MSAQSLMSGGVVQMPRGVLCIIRCMQPALHNQEHVSTGFTILAVTASCTQEAWLLQAQLRANQQQGTRFSSPKRTAHFGSQSHIGTDRLLVSTNSISSQDLHKDNTYIASGSNEVCW